MNTEFLFNENVFVSARLQELCRGKRVCIFADSAIAQNAGERLRLHLDAELVPLSGNESCKTREEKQRLEDLLIEQKYNRETLIIGMGGGSLTDLVGFVASTYMRGVSLILVPTTLLGMVDAAIGGKNGVNTPAGKNLIGTVYPPMAVCIDLQLLQTLPQKEWLNGLAEILKHGLIYDAQIWDLCEKNPLSWQTEENLIQLIFSSIRIKTEVAEKDPNEKGVRRILNFGHTVGHGLEFLSQFEMSHGEAVAIGCMAESWLSSHLGYLSQTALERILDLYQKCGYKMRLPKNFSKKTLRHALQRDKKSLQNQPRFVLIEGIGKSVFFNGEFCTPIQDTDFEALVDWMEKKAR